MGMTSCQEKNFLTDDSCNDQQKAFKGFHGRDLIIVGDFSDKLGRKEYRRFIWGPHARGHRHCNDDCCVSSSPKTSSLPRTLSVNMKPAIQQHLSKKEKTLPFFFKQSIFLLDSTESNQ